MGKWVATMILQTGNKQNADPARWGGGVLPIGHRPYRRLDICDTPVPRGVASPTFSHRAFTLIELILVMALLLIVLGVAFPSLKSFFQGRNLDAEARRFLSLTHYGQSRAVSEGLPMMLWIDAPGRAYGLQVQTGYTETDDKAVQYTLDKDLDVQ